MAQKPEFKDVPKIVETPYITQHESSTDKVMALYKEEIEMFRLGKIILIY